MQEKTRQYAGRTALMILFPAVCLLLLTALVLETFHVVSLYRRTNSELFVYRSYVSAEKHLEAESSVFTEQARLFVYSGLAEHLNDYFAETETGRSSERAAQELEASGDPYSVSEALAPLAERAEALRTAELHAMKLRALSCGMGTNEMPAPVADYPLSEREERLNSEQKRDKANELVYGEAYCSEKSAIAAERKALFAEAEGRAADRVYSLNKETSVSLNLQRVLLGVSVAAVAGLILFLKRQRKLDARAEAARLEELEAAKSRAEAEDRTKTAFLLNVSHDIRMPMNEILGFTNLAQKHIDDPACVMDSLQKIKSSSGHLLNIINDILELDRIENSTLEITEIPADIMRSGEEIQAVLSSQAVSKGVDYAMEIHDIRDRYVYVDIMHMVRVLVNLVSNAIKYTPAGGRVRLGIEQVGPAKDGWADYLFTVSDTGIGMTEEFVTRLFDAYAREKNPAEGTRGAGLGLTITKKLVDSMGGSISVKSEPGKGSVFTVRMPFRLQTEAEVEAHYGAGRKEDPVAGQLGTGLLKKRILLADDNELAREITGEVLRSEGAETVKAIDGADAVRLFSEKPAGYYDLILMDTHMPVLNGFEAAGRIRALKAGREVPLIMLASAPQEEDKVNAMAAGADAMLLKPLDIEELLAALKKYCWNGQQSAER